MLGCGRAVVSADAEGGAAPPPRQIGAMLVAAGGVLLGVVLPSMIFVHGSSKSA